MFYLVRDASRPFHPIIGIAALGSSLVQLTARDNVIGWSSQSMLTRINSTHFTAGDAKKITCMRNYSGAHATGKGVPAKTAAMASSIERPCLRIVER